ncbi:MAG: hypothetical protein Q9201_005481 [Fulgogasparrea decipioides]
MGPKPANVFAGGWSAQKAAKLNQVQLPEKTRCNRCHKIKTTANYSNKQLLDLKHRIAGPQGEKAKSAIAEIITCRACTGGPVNELTCCICGEVKSLDGFSKAQRKDPDAARCILCLHEQAEDSWAHTDLAGGESDDEDSDDDSYAETATNPYTNASYQDEPEVNAATSALKEVNLSQHDKAYGAAGQHKGSTTVSRSNLLGSYSDEESKGASFNKGKSKGKENEWQTFALKGSGKKPIEFTGYDSKGDAHRQVRAPSSVCSEDSVKIVTSARSGPSASSTYKVRFLPICSIWVFIIFVQETGSRARFAKVSRGDTKPRQPDNVTQQLKASATARTVSYSDDEDSSDDHW